jgi:hypothetical protein
MRYEPRNDGEMVMDHPEFDDAMREKFEKEALKLDEAIRDEGNKVKKMKMVKIADAYYEAISELDGMTKSEAVDWIQVNSGGRKGAEVLSFAQKVVVLKKIPRMNLKHFEQAACYRNTLKKKSNNSNK